jgi:polyketide cyclase/dehydrase/lipid transport protein
MELTRSVDIQAPPDVVWEVWADVERWAEWTASITRIERFEAGPLAIGHRARVQQPKLPTAVWRVTKLEEGRGFEWVSASPGSHVMGYHWITPQGSGSRARLGVVFSGPIARLVGWLTRSLTERYLALEAAGLKARSEERTKRR